MSSWTFCRSPHNEILFALWFKTTLQDDFVVWWGIGIIQAQMWVLVLVLLLSKSRCGWVLVLISKNDSWSLIWYWIYVALKRHCRTHKMQRPFSCTTCDYSFHVTFGLQDSRLEFSSEFNFYIVALKRHCRTHKMRRPFSCTTCGY